MSCGSTSAWCRAASGCAAPTTASSSVAGCATARLCAWNGARATWMISSKNCSSAVRACWPAGAASTSTSTPAAPNQWRRPTTSEPLSSSPCRRKLRRLGSTRVSPVTRGQCRMSRDERRFRPQLRSVANREHVRLAVYFAIALFFTAAVGCCCLVPFRANPPSTVLIVQLTVAGALWCWLVCRLTFFSPTRQLERALGRYGEARGLMDEIDAELREASVVWLRPRRPRGPTPTFIVLTPNWLVQIRSAGAEAIKVAELVWIYKR